MQTLPIFLDRLADPVTAILLSITVVLIFGARSPCLHALNTGRCWCSGKACCAAAPQACSGRACVPARHCSSLMRAVPCCLGGVVATEKSARAGEIIPQAVCTRYGLAVGAYSAWFVQALMVLTSPLSYPLSRLLDWVLGSDHTARP